MRAQLERVAVSVWPQQDRATERIFPNLAIVDDGTRYLAIVDDGTHTRGHSTMTMFKFIMLAALFLFEIQVEQKL